MRHLGATEHGLVLDETDEFENVPPEDLRLGLGVDEAIDDEGYLEAAREDSEDDGMSDSGFSDSADEDELDDELDDNVAQEIAEAVQINSSTPAAKVPRVMAPVSDQEQCEFFDILNQIRADDVVPEGYGLGTGEQDYDEWEDQEDIGQVGNVKNTRITLVEAEWRPRVIEWVQAIEAWHHFEASA